MADDSRTARNVGLVLFGAAVGAALGVLLAPKSGKETREDILDWLKERREKSTQLLGRIKENLPAKKEQLVAAIKAGKQAYAAAARNGEVDAANN